MVVTVAGQTLAAKNPDPDSHLGVKKWPKSECVPIVHVSQLPNQNLSKDLK